MDGLPPDKPITEEKQPEEKVNENDPFSTASTLHTFSPWYDSVENDPLSTASLFNTINPWDNIDENDLLSTTSIPDSLPDIGDFDLADFGFSEDEDNVKKDLAPVPSENVTQEQHIPDGNMIPQEDSIKEDVALVPCENVTQEQQHVTISESNVMQSEEETENRKAKLQKIFDMIFGTSPNRLDSQNSNDSQNQQQYLSDSEITEPNGGAQGSTPSETNQLNQVQASTVNPMMSTISPDVQPGSRRQHRGSFRLQRGSTRQWQGSSRQWRGSSRLQRGSSRQRLGSSSQEQGSNQQKEVEDSTVNPIPSGELTESPISSPGVQGLK